MERSIRLHAHEVRGIRNGRQTQIRRVVKGAPTNREAYLLGCHKWTWGIHEDVEKDGGVHRFKCPFGGPGDMLWVQETFAKVFDPDDGSFVYEYRADTGNKYPGEWPDDAGDDPECGRWKPSIHMPREASRITLEVKAVRVERLSNISEADAIAEGVEPSLMCDAKDRFCNLWVSIYGDGSFDANRWVWVIEFERMVV